MDIRICDTTKGIPLDDDSVDVIVTSPPYFALRSYGDDETELGRPGSSLDSYLEGLMSTMAECQRILKPTGLLWLNIGDTASGSGGAGGDYNTGGSRSGRPKWRQGETGVPKMSWCSVPSSVAALMVSEQKWLLRSEIVWDKGIERREDLSHVRRPRPAHEMIYMFAKSRDYKWNPDGLVETGTVWHFSPSAGKGKGPAPFPEELVERCLGPCGLLAGDLVADPFCGAGTSLRVAERMNYKAIGFDLYLPQE